MIQLIFLELRRTCIVFLFLVPLQIRVVHYARTLRTREWQRGRTEVEEERLRDKLREKRRSAILAGAR